ncbi:TlpA family protein disulfide reductase [Mariniflexile sp. AS56]|uniref:TlpA family protein disulfide reductase n=1 Tax=Mariniflexile sp. AS56 TaxID=3063957 RepID=UPI0026F2ED7E|nr:TlpA disulfide reductase family protein [Mariniflexile sp. AS56]MDO7171558.1 TlpA disulfide reductase family protein [Mariniflexile sp. AS56]
MKNTFIVIALALMSLSCQNKEAKTINYNILSGNIGSTKGGELNISSLNGFKKTINVTDTGFFSDTLFIPENGLYNIRFEQVRFAPYLSKGGNVQLNVDAKKPASTLKLSGDNIALNSYFAYKASKNSEFMMNRETSYNVDESDFEIKINNFSKDLEQHLEAVKDIPEGIKVKELRAINFGRLAKKSNYEFMYGHLNKNRDFKASDAFKGELSKISFDNGDDYLYSSDYQQMVSNNIREKAFNYYEKDSLPYPEAEAQAITEINNETIRNVELYKSFSMQLTRSSDKETDLNKFLSASTNEAHKTSIKELFESLKVLDKGQPSPKFENFENYAGGTTSLDDLKGKYVYIDVWATWCGPCKAEIPFLKKIEKQYHGKNIHFVSLSADKQKDKDKWKKMIADKELGGIQLISDNDFNTPFVNDYKIMGIPQFILLDPEGNIVRANAPRPSDAKLIELFDKLKI